MPPLVVYKLSAGLPDYFLHVVGIYDDLTGEFLTDVRQALEAGLTVSCERSVMPSEEYDAAEPLADAPFLHRFATALLDGPFMCGAERDWLLSRRLVEKVEPQAHAEAQRVTNPHGTGQPWRP